MSQCEAAESSSQVNPQVIDGKERSPLDEVLRQGACRWWCATVTPASAPSSAAWVS